MQICYQNFCFIIGAEQIDFVENEGEDGELVMPQSASGVINIFFIKEIFLYKVSSFYMKLNSDNMLSVIISDISPILYL